MLSLMMVIGLFTIVPLSASAKEWSGDVYAYSLAVGDVITANVESLFSIGYTLVLKGCTERIVKNYHIRKSLLRQYRSA